MALKSISCHVVYLIIEFGAKKNKPSDYRGGRTKSEIVQYVKSSEEAKALGVRSVSVATLEFSNVHTFLTQNEKLPSVIFFGSAAATTSSKKGKKKAGGKVCCVCMFDIMVPTTWRCTDFLCMCIIITMCL